MRTRTALFVVGIAAAAVGVAFFAPVYAGQAIYTGQVSGSPFGLISAATSATMPYVVPVKGGGGGGGNHGNWSGHHGNWSGHHGRWWGHHRRWWGDRDNYYGPYCNNWVWDGYQYTCYDDDEY